ncbi:hypothetical protein [Oscillibacter sp.]|uniref:hypothetical protein n=1 Tax=Oscillibacter sp. TaxID=1945593 RepID=UPI00289A94C0|nr:hypothetical protein [Oscillibacter sp.]
MEMTDAPQFYEWLTTYDRERVMNLIGQLYFSESADVNALPPSQRLRGYLAFDRTLFSVEAREQEYSCFLKVLRNHMLAGEAFGKYEGQNKRRNTGTRRKADFKAGCQAIREYNLRIPRGTMARFEEPQELVMYLLRYTILSDKHIKKCEFYGRFFVLRRSTRQYCSPAYASKQRNLDGFCGEREVSAAYKRIVANLTTKDKKQKELRRQYCLDGGAVVKPREVLRQFYEENYAHQEQFRFAWEALNKAEKKSWADRQTYEQAKADYLSWLDSRLSYAKQIHIDNDSILEE